MTKTWKSIGPMLIAEVTLPSVVLACPACKDALEGDAVGMALSWTTLLMIAIPMMLVASIGGWVFYLYWRAARQAAAAPAPRVAVWPLWNREGE